MLSERHTKLVIDYVDGTLSARQRKTVLQLLHKSPKAQRLLEQLQANVDLLRSLPKHSIDPQFVIGYGLDYAERYRNIPEIQVLSD